MDTHTIALMNIPISLTFMVLILTIARLRQAKSLYYHAMAFALAAASTVLLLGQGHWNAWFSTVGFNVLFSLVLILFSAGFRAFFQLQPVPQRHLAYLLIVTGLIIAFTFGRDSFGGRVLTISWLITLILVDLLRSLRQPLRQLQRPVRWLFQSVVMLTILFCGLRAVLILLSSLAAQSMLDQSWISVWSLIAITTDFGIWAATILILDSECLVCSLRVKNRELADLALKDQLTSLPNRYFLERELDDMAATARRMSQPLSLILLDLDHFKQINDAFGHDVGDQILAQVARVIQATIRKSDIPCRWGGEEFIVIAPQTRSAAAARLGERLRVAVRDAIFPMVGPVTISGGVAEYQPDEAPDTWFKRADVALYRAKACGRNHIHVWSGDDRLPAAAGDPDDRTDGLLEFYPG